MLYRRSIQAFAILPILGASALAACASTVGETTDGSESNLSGTRGIVGVPADFPVADKSPGAAARLADELARDMKQRRAHAWSVLEKSSRPFKVKGQNGMPNVAVPLWMTWYEGDEIGEILKVALDAKKTSGSTEPAPALSNEDIEIAMKIHGGQARGIRKAASFKRPLPHDDTFDPQTNLLLKPTGFTLFSPSYVRHVVRNYASIAACASGGTKPAVFDKPAFDAALHAQNFSAPCFDAEFPPDAVMVKAVWRPIDQPVPFFDTSESGLTKIFADVSTSWDVAQIGTKRIDPAAREMLIVKDDEAKSWGLVALHLSTKETRNWAWSTYFWSPDEIAKSDFGADRDANLFSGAAPDEETQTIREMLDNYKMCTTVDFEERDVDLATRFGGDGDGGSLTRALLKADELVNRAPLRFGSPVTDVDGTKVFGKAAPRATWCSNPYVEHHPGNTHTNCIGCHQHAGTGISFNETFYLGTSSADWHHFPKYGTTKVRGVVRVDSPASATANSGTFPTDFSWGGEFEMRPMFQDIISGR